jgi:glycogen operon protein
VGEGGYQVGNFPPLWSEWNGRYRDEVREAWAGHDHGVARLLPRLLGSRDLYEARGPAASINFVTSHDGFTLRDLVTYEHKRNDENGEGNRDGEPHNRPIRCGHEGETDDPRVNALRAQQRRNLLATLLLSAGVPMITAGDELGRTQLGNNNAYCQDNATSWLDWSRIDGELLRFTKDLIALRRRTQLFALGFRHTQSRAFRSDGLAAHPEDLSDPALRALALWIGADEASARGGSCAQGALLLINTGAMDLRFTLPHAARSGSYRHVLDTHEPARAAGRGVLAPGTPVRLAAHSLRLLEEAP